MREIIVGAILTIACCVPSDCRADRESDRDAIVRTRAELLAAFCREDLTEVSQLLAPEFRKAIRCDKFLEGREAVIEDMRTTFRAFTFEISGDREESIDFLGDVCVQQSTYELHGMPKESGARFTVRGRVLIVYRRSGRSPTGWLLTHEIIQQCSN